MKFCRLRSRTDDAQVAKVSLGVVLGNLGGAGFGVPGRRGVRLLGHDSSWVGWSPVSWASVFESMVPLHNSVRLSVP